MPHRTHHALGALAAALLPALANATPAPSGPTPPQPLATLSGILALAPTIAARLATAKPHAVAGLVPAARVPPPERCSAAALPDPQAAASPAAKPPPAPVARPRFALTSWLAANAARQPRAEAEFLPTTGPSALADGAPVGTNTSHAKPPPAPMAIKAWKP
jgi:hypothetical protein